LPIMTLQQLSKCPLNIPVATSWLLADLGEAKGRQELYTGREPERLRVLREHALIESAISSNRIEGVVVEQARVEQVVLGRSVLKDRDEQEVRGYREALSWIHENHRSIRISAETILRLHFLSHGQTGDAGQFKVKDSDIIEKYPDGRTRVRFKPCRRRRRQAAWTSSSACGRITGASNGRRRQSPWPRPTSIFCTSIRSAMGTGVCRACCCY